jgi:hypothetical protein
VANSFEENDCENTNTHAHGDVYLVVLAYSMLFVEVKHLFSTTPVAEIFSKSSWIEMEANRGHWGDQTLNRTWSRHDQTCPVSGSSSRVRGAARVSNRSVRWVMGPECTVKPRETAKHAKSIGRGSASGHDRPDV